jgi:protein-L-isoaspartate(D-aspartate) O-methyltransferase
MTIMTKQANAGNHAARRAMIDSQLRTSGVNEPWVLAAMASLDREDFVPPALRAAAYIDRAIPLGEGRWLAAPLVQGRMLAEAKPTPADRALLIGDRNGYLAALLRPLVGLLDVLAPGEAAAEHSAEPYTLMVIDGAIEQLPDSVAAALTDGGRLVTGLALRGLTRLAVGRKTGGHVALMTLAELGMPVLSEFAAPKRWSF